MIRRIKGSQDLTAGAMFVAIGLLAIVVGRDYPLGSWQRPGTGVLPMILAWCLVGIGGVITIKGLLIRGAGLLDGVWAWRPVIMVTLAGLAFALLVNDGGLVVSMVVSMAICAAGTPETRWREFAIFSVIMVVIGVALFIKGLGMPIKVFPWN
ncbi:MAG: tripartite tricarboxylate transporter TctB family protein [Acetobacteraceae bacterium]|nr:tripartite tricarboxylate transporter TctB family protein [Acetobacteraceae bacterium]